MRRRSRATIQRADAEHIQIKGPQGMRRTKTKSDAEAIQIKGPQREEKCDDTESGCGGKTDKESAEG